MSGSRRRRRGSLGLLEAGAGPLRARLGAASDAVEEAVAVLRGEHDVVVEHVRHGEPDPRRHAVVVHAQLRLRPEQAEVPQLRARHTTRMHLCFEMPNKKRLHVLYCIILL